MDALAQIVLSQDLSDRMTLLVTLRKMLPAHAQQQLVKTLNASSESRKKYFQSEEYQNELQKQYRTIYGIKDENARVSIKKD